VPESNLILHYNTKNQTPWGKDPWIPTHWTCAVWKCWPRVM